MQISEYYRNDAVRKRILEFLGGTEADSVSSVYIARCCNAASDRFFPQSPRRLQDFFDGQLDIGRSLWDKESLTMHLDIDYVNYDFPGEAYLYPDRVFELVEPVSQAVLDFLDGYQIYPQHNVSGRGHHFVWNLGLDSPEVQQLALLSRMPMELRLRYAQVRGPDGERISDTLGQAFSGAGVIMEYLTHAVIQSCRDKCQIPLHPMTLRVTPQQRGKEMICLDISEYADQMDTRVVRVPFSAYLKPWDHQIMSEDVLPLVPRTVPVPCDQMTMIQAVATMRDLRKAIELAESTSSWIPQQHGRWVDLIGDYKRSDLARFHSWFYSKAQAKPDDWPGGYDRAIYEIAPECVRAILMNPNPRLLQPSHMRLVIVTMLGMGWHGRDIAGLLRSRYEKDFGWGNYWYVYEAASRSDYYVRLLIGLIALGLDNLEDVDCYMCKQMGLCYAFDKECLLNHYRDQALQRRYL